jgi:predicted RNase H-like HicB family nuclease
MGGGFSTVVQDYRINIFYSPADAGYISDPPDLEACSAFGETAARHGRRSG